MEPAWERYGHYSHALGPVLCSWLPRPQQHTNAVCDPLSVLLVQRVGSTFIPRCQKLDTQLIPAGE